MHTRVYMCICRSIFRIHLILREWRLQGFHTPAYMHVMAKSSGFFPQGQAVHKLALILAAECKYVHQIVDVDHFSAPFVAAGGKRSSVEGLLHHKYGIGSHRRRVRCYS
eukprot:4642611-Amphidinium_carterae.1